MNTKKSVKVLSLILFGLFLLNFVCAIDSIDNQGNPIIGGGDSKVNTDIAQGIKDTMGVIGKSFYELLSPFFGDSELLSRAFLAILLGLLVYSAVKTFFSNSRFIALGVTFAVTALALLGLPPSFLLAIRTQYGAMGATLLSFIPFFIILWFSLKTESALLARIIWIFYFFYYLSLFGYGILTIGWNGKVIPYMGAMLAGLMIFIFIPRLRNLIFKGELEGLEQHGLNKVQRRRTLQKIQDEDLGRYAS